jgi:hypothetical protein
MFRTALLLAGMAAVGTAAAQPGPIRYPESRPALSPPVTPRPEVV